jgi:hypothetical protein
MANKPNFLHPNSAPKPTDARPGNATFLNPTHKPTGLKEAALADVKSRLILGTKLV